ncbi:MAG: hypothetical protein LBC92_05915, partial [Rickettsiales bacterium]|nr:hypothetical protein [Rickettsiales bacterium]
FLYCTESEVEKYRKKIDTAKTTLAALTEKKLKKEKEQGGESVFEKFKSTIVSKEKELKSFFETKISSCGKKYDDSYFSKDDVLKRPNEKFVSEVINETNFIKNNSDLLSLLSEKYLAEEESLSDLLKEDDMNINHKEEATKLFESIKLANKNNLEVVKKSIEKIKQTDNYKQNVKTAEEQKKTEEASKQINNLKNKIDARSIKLLVDAIEKFKFSNGLIKGNTIHGSVNIDNGEEEEEEEIIEHCLKELNDEKAGKKHLIPAFANLINTTYNDINVEIVANILKGNDLAKNDKIKEFLDELVAQQNKQLAIVHKKAEEVLANGELKAAELKPLVKIVMTPVESPKMPQSNQPVGRFSLDVNKIKTVRGDSKITLPPRRDNNRPPAPSIIDEPTFIGFRRKAFEEVLLYPSFPLEFKERLLFENNKLMGDAVGSICIKDMQFVGGGNSILTFYRDFTSKINDLTSNLTSKYVLNKAAMDRKTKISSFENSQLNERAKIEEQSIIPLSKLIEFRKQAFNDVVWSDDKYKGKFEFDNNSEVIIIVNNGPSEIISDLYKKFVKEVSEKVNEIISKAQESGKVLSKEAGEKNNSIKLKQETIAMDRYYAEEQFKKENPQQSILKDSNLTANDKDLFEGVDNLDMNIQLPGVGLSDKSGDKKPEKDDKSNIKEILKLEKDKEIDEPELVKFIQEQFKIISFTKILPANEALYINKFTIPTEDDGSIENVRGALKMLSPSSAAKEDDNLSEIYKGIIEKDINCLSFINGKTLTPKAQERLNNISTYQQQQLADRTNTENSTIINRVINEIENSLFGIVVQKLTDSNFKESDSITKTTTPEGKVVGIGYSDNFIQLNAELLADEEIVKDLLKFIDEKSSKLTEEEIENVKGKLDKRLTDDIINKITNNVKETSESLKNSFVRLKEQSKDYFKECKKQLISLRQEECKELLKLENGGFKGLEKFISINEEDPYNVSIEYFNNNSSEFIFSINDLCRLCEDFVKQLNQNVEEKFNLTNNSIKTSLLQDCINVDNGELFQLQSTLELIQLREGEYRKLLENNKELDGRISIDGDSGIILNYDNTDGKSILSISNASVLLTDFIEKLEQLKEVFNPNNDKTKANILENYHEDDNKKLPELQEKLNEIKDEDNPAQLELLVDEKKSILSDLLAGKQIKRQPSASQSILYSIQKGVEQQESSINDTILDFSGVDSLDMSISPESITEHIAEQPNFSHLTGKVEVSDEGVLQPTTNSDILSIDYKSLTTEISSLLSNQNRRQNKNILTKESEILNLLNGKEKFKGYELTDDSLSVPKVEKIITEPQLVQFREKAFNNWISTNAQFTDAFSFIKDKDKDNDNRGSILINEGFIDSIISSHSTSPNKLSDSLVELLSKYKELKEAVEYGTTQSINETQLNNEAQSRQSSVSTIESDILNRQTSIVLICKNIEDLSSNTEQLKSQLLEGFSNDGYTNIDNNILETDQQGIIVVSDTFIQSNAKTIVKNGTQKYIDAANTQLESNINEEISKHQNLDASLIEKIKNATKNFKINIESFLTPILSPLQNKAQDILIEEFKNSCKNASVRIQEFNSLLNQAGGKYLGLAKRINIDTTGKIVITFNDEFISEADLDLLPLCKEFIEAFQSNLIEKAKLGFENISIPENAIKECKDIDKNVLDVLESIITEPQLVDFIKSRFDEHISGYPLRKNDITFAEQGEGRGSIDILSIGDVKENYRYDISSNYQTLSDALKSDVKDFINGKTLTKEATARIDSIDKYQIQQYLNRKQIENDEVKKQEELAINTAFEIKKILLSEFVGKIVNMGFKGISVNQIPAITTGEQSKNAIPNLFNDNFIQLNAKLIVDDDIIKQFGDFIETKSDEITSKEIEKIKESSSLWDETINSINASIKEGKTQFETLLSSKKDIANDKLSLFENFKSDLKTNMSLSASDLKSRFLMLGKEIKITEGQNIHSIENDLSIKFEEGFIIDNFEIFRATDGLSAENIANALFDIQGKINSLIGDDSKNYKSIKLMA